MRINNLKLINFRSHRMSLIEFKKKINFVFGPNGIGKTSILDGICFLIDGRNSRTSKSGAGSNDLITFGEGRAMLEAEVDNVGKICRTIPHTLSVNAGKEGIREAQQLIYDGIGVSSEKIYACINSTFFPSLTSREKKDFLFELMGYTVNNENIKEDYIAWARENGVRKPEELFDRFAGNMSFSSQKDIDDAYAELVSQRKVMKRRIATLVAQAKDTAVELPDGATIDSEDKIKDRILDLQKTEKELITAKAEFTGRIKELSKITNSEVSGYDPDVIACQLDNYNNNMQEIMKEKYELEVDLQSNEKLLAAIKEWTGKCPVFNIDCPLDNIETSEMVDDIVGKIRVAREKLQIFSERISKGNEMIETGKDRLKKSRASRTQKEVDDAYAEIKKLEDEYKADTLNVRITSTGDDIKRGQQILTKIMAEKARLKNREGDKSERLQLEKDLKNINYVIDGFGPNGIKSIVLTRVLNPIRDRVRDRMQGLSRGKYEMDLRLEEDDLKIYLSSDGIEREFGFLSSSEQLRVQIIMQDVISHLTGLRFLIVDDVDRLDKESRKSFIRLLKTIEDDYDQIVALCTGESYGMDDDIHEIDLS